MTARHHGVNLSGRTTLGDDAISLAGKNRIMCYLISKDRTTVLTHCFIVRFSRYNRMEARIAPRIIAINKPVAII